METQQEAANRVVRAASAMRGGYQAVTSYVEAATSHWSREQRAEVWRRIATPAADNS